MRFAGIDVKHTKKVIDMLDPIDFTLMDGLVNDAVVSPLRGQSAYYFRG